MGNSINVQVAKGSSNKSSSSSSSSSSSTFKKPKEAAPNPAFVDRCCVKNLSYDITEEVLFEAFEKLGIEAKHVSWINDRETGNFYGTSFVTFGSADDAAWALACSNAGLEVLGRHVRVEYCPHRNDKRKAQASGGGKDDKPGKRTDVARPPSARPEGGTKTAFFGNLPFEIDDDMLRKFCSEVGA